MSERKEPGQLCYEATDPVTRWWFLRDDEKAAWAKREAAIYEDAAKCAGEFSAPNRFHVTDDWKENTPAEVYGIAASDVSGWLESAIRAKIGKAAKSPPPRKGRRD